MSDMDINKEFPSVTGSYTETTRTYTSDGAVSERVRENASLFLDTLVSEIPDVRSVDVKRGFEGELDRYFENVASTFSMLVPEEIEVRIASDGDEEVVDAYMQQMGYSPESDDFESLLERDLQYRESSILDKESQVLDEEERLLE